MSDIVINLDEKLCVPVINHNLSNLIKLTEKVWPGEALCATQEMDGEIIYWSDGYQKVKEARKAANISDGLIPLLGFSKVVHSNYYDVQEQCFVANDWQTAVIKKDELARWFRR